MEEKRTFRTQSLMAIFALNALLTLGLYLLSPETLQDSLLLVVVLYVVLSATAWWLVNMLAGKAIDAAVKTAAPAPARTKTPQVTPKPAPPQLDEPRETAAVQILSILQREGRLIDFLQEDLANYDDAQIGAAVRSVHEGCKKALKEHVSLEPVYQQEEGSPVVLQPDFDAHAVRLIGDVSGNPPFRGVLRHRGWRISRITLPERVQGQEKEMIVAAAEVEVNG